MVSEEELRALDKKDKHKGKGPPVVMGEPKFTKARFDALPLSLRREFFGVHDPETIDLMVDFYAGQQAMLGNPSASTIVLEAVLKMVSTSSCRGLSEALKVHHLGVQPAEFSRVLGLICEATVQGNQPRPGGGCLFLQPDQWAKLPRGNGGIQGVAALVSSTADMTGLERVETGVRTDNFVANVVSWVVVASVKGQVLYIGPMFGGAVDPGLACELDISPGCCCYAGISSGPVEHGHRACP
jgi:hypothetical protein